MIVTHNENIPKLLALLRLFDRDELMCQVHYDTNGQRSIHLVGTTDPHSSFVNPDDGKMKALGMAELVLDLFEPFVLPYSRVAVELDGDHETAFMYFVFAVGEKPGQLELSFDKMRDKPSALDGLLGKSPTLGTGRSIVIQYQEPPLDILHSLTFEDLLNLQATMKLFDLENVNGIGFTEAGKSPMIYHFLSAEKSNKLARTNLEVLVRKVYNKIILPAFSKLDEGSNPQENFSFFIGSGISPGRLDLSISHSPVSKREEEVNIHLGNFYNGAGQGKSMSMLNVTVPEEFLIA